MLAWLMLPKVVLGVGALALVASIWGSVWWNTRDLKRDLAATKLELKTTQEEAAKAAAQAAQNEEREAENRAKQQAAIDQQNARIRNMAATVRQAETAATLAALRVIAESRAEADALLDASSTVPVGYEALNEWQDQWKQRLGEGK